MGDVTLTGEFEQWLEREGIALSRSQVDAAARLLADEPALFSAGWGAGKTFLLEALDRFFNERHEERFAAGKS